jgi:RHS repeat-associated protein
VAFAVPVVVPEDGFIYIWLSNESEGTEVWFDDLSIRHTQTLVAQATDYGVWGEVLREQRSDARKYRFGYQGQYAEKDEETGWNHFELRQYDAVIGRTLTVDPARQFFSPYAWVGNNPVRGIDPTGGLSPIYGLDGKFLGTDNQGLQGEAIFMHESHFFQGMSHELALEAGFTFSQYLSLGVDLGVSASVFKHWQGLSSRPDWDGFLTLEEANEWYRNGGGQPLYVDASKIDLSPVSTANFGNSTGKSIYYNFFTDGRGSLTTGRVYGTIKLTLLNTHGAVKLGGANGLLDVYDFDINWNDGRLMRNIGTAIGEINAGKGTGYNIYNYGTGSVRADLNWFYKK